MSSQLYSFVFNAASAGSEVNSKTIHFRAADETELRVQSLISDHFLVFLEK